MPFHEIFPAIVEVVVVSFRSDLDSVEDVNASAQQVTTLDSAVNSVERGGVTRGALDAISGISSWNADAVAAADITEILLAVGVIVNLSGMYFKLNWEAVSSVVAVASQSVELFTGERVRSDEFTATGALDSEEGGGGRYAGSVRAAHLFQYKRLIFHFYI